MARRKIVSQAWVELLSDDPESLSALQVARDRIPSARHLTGLRRVRLLELSGALPRADEQEALLHRSIQFYNPNKERCTLRTSPEDPAPLRAGEQVVLVTERGGERRAAAELWWRHVTDQSIEVREGIVWALAFDGAGDAIESMKEVVLLRDRRHGVLCNPISQEARFAEGVIPIPWMKKAPRSRSGGTEP
jgi:hypothetical protein